MASILITNDDGIDGVGLRVLTAAAVAAGHDVRVVAPDRDYSGAGGSLLTIDGRAPSLEDPSVTYEQRTLPEASDAPAYAVAGPPALCVLLTMRGAFGGPPDAVVSGINFGLNVGPAVLHSGTVGAALAAAGAGVPGLAVSAEYSPDHDDDLRYDTAAELAMHVLQAQLAGDHLTINLNVPRCSFRELAGVRSAPLASVARWRSEVESWGDGVVKRSFKISDIPVPAESDSGLVRAGFASVTSLSRIGSVDCADLVAQIADAAA